MDCAAYLTGTEWVTGSSDGSVAVWSQLKKKPVAVVRGAHYAGVSATAGFPFTNPDGDAAVESAAGDTGNSAPEEASSREMGADVPLGPGSVGGDCASWVSAVAVCKGTDLVVRQPNLDLAPPAQSLLCNRFGNAFYTGHVSV